MAKAIFSPPTPITAASITNPEIQAKDIKLHNIRLDILLATLEGGSRINIEMQSVVRSGFNLTPQCELHILELPQIPPYSSSTRNILSHWAQLLAAPSCFSSRTASALSLRRYENAMETQDSSR